MRLITGLLLSTLALGACSKKDENQAAQQTASVPAQAVVPVANVAATAVPTVPQPSASVPVVPPTVPTTGQIMTKTIFNCTEKISFAVQFESGPNQARVVFAKMQPLILPQIYTPSGFWYRSNDVELRGKGRQATLSMKGRKPVTCTSTL